MPTGMVVGVTGISRRREVNVTAKPGYLARVLRVVLAFLTFLGAVVLIPGSPRAEAAVDDLTVAVAVDNNAIFQGAVSNWTLTVGTSADMTMATGIVVTDTLPDGLCPDGAGDPDCTGGVAASPDYTTATENSNGTWTLIWYLADMGPSTQTQITFSTEAGAYYQEGFADDTPVLARDSWTNAARVDGTVDGTDVNDTATVGQTAGGVAVTEEIATRPATLTQPAVCSDGAGLTWNDTAATSYRVGDQVCWRISVVYPSGLTTADSQVTFPVPTGQTYTANDTWAPGSGNTVPVSDVDGAGVVTGAGTLTWNIGDGAGYVASGERLEVVVSTTITKPAATSSGQNVTSIANHYHHTTSGSTITNSDAAIVKVLEPEVHLTKGVIAVNTVSTGGSLDGVTVKEDDVVTYRLSVSNSGGVDAADVVVWDLLPDLLAPCTSQISTISDGGACDDAANRVEWTGPSTLSVGAGATVAVTYDATIPSGIAPSTTLGNHAGVVSYTSATNNDPFSYVPSSNVDAGAGSSNTASADDASNVVTPAVTLASTRTTGITESGNNASSQATIGELITYTVTLAVPEGTTVWDARLFDDLPANLDLVSSSHTFDGEEALVLTEDGAADSVTIDFPDPSYRNAPGTGNDTLVLTLVARVIDVPANSRGTSIGNSAAFTWLDQNAVFHTKGTSVSTTVVEPLLSIAKTSVDSIGNNGTVVGNETVDYTLTVTNPATTSVGTAHDLEIVDTLPEGVTLTIPVPDGGVWAADGTPGDGVGGTITWSVASLAAASSLARTYEVTIDDPVVVSTTFVNTVTVDGSSIAGAAAVERSAGTGYHASAGRILNTPLAGLSRDVDPGSATIGDVVTYTLDVTMPPGTIMYDATVIDSLPAGMEFDGLVSSNCDMGGGPCDPMVTATEIGIAGSTTAAFFFGDIDISSATGEERVVTIEYRAHLLDSGVAGNTRVSSASVYGNQTDKIAGTPSSVPLPSSFDVAVGPATDTVTVVEPRLTIDKDVAGQVGDGDYRRAVPGENLSFTIVATGSSASHTSAAYDLVIVDTLPEGLAVTLPVPGGGVWVADPTPGDGVGGTITWTDPGPLAPGASLTRTYEATVDASLNSSDEDDGSREATNTADITSYYAVAAAARAANPTFTYRNYDNVTADTVQVELDLASIGSAVWFDVDADGVWDAGEPPFPGVDLTMTYLGLDGVVSGDDEPHLVTTASDGSALVEHLPGGSYTVVVDASDIPAGFVPSYDLDGGTLSPDGGWGPGPLGESEDKLDVDFGYTGSGSIGGTVWFDSDRDGMLDGAEYRLEGVTLTVTWLGLDGVPGGDDVVYTTATDGSGGFLISRLPGGIYTIDIDDATVPAGMGATYDTDGVGTPGSTVVILGGGTVDPDEDFGYAGTGTLGDFVWLDRDGDGVQDGTEPGIVGVPVQLTWPGEDGVLGGGDDEPFLTSTDSDGLYTFANMPPGEYQVTILAGLPEAAPNTFDEDGGSDATAVVTLSDGETHLTADFGFHGTASIGDIVWWDLDGNGALDAGEPGIPGVAVALTYAGLDGTFGNGDDLSFATTTGAGGGFLLADLPAGDYRVVIDSGVPGGLVQTYDEDGGLDGVSLVAGLTVDEIHLTADFGYEGTGSIGDYIWLDIDSDGVQDVAEPGLPAVDVAVTWFGVDGTPATADDFTLDTTTDIDGNYGVSGLPAGGYGVAVDPGSLPTGVIPTHDYDGLSTLHRSVTTLAGGATDDTQDFGYDGGADIGDLIWFDQDGDGAPGTAEYGIEGVVVDVIWAGPDGIHATADDETFTATTGPDGSYLVSNLPPGNYAVVVDPASLPSGMVGSNDEDGVLDDRTLFAVAEGETHLSADFGYYGTGSIGDLVWFDQNGDGTVGADEPGIPGQDVEMIAAGGDNVIGTADDEIYDLATDGDGSYLFANLPPGTYRIAITGVIVSRADNTYDEDGDHNSGVDVTLAGGATDHGSDFGYHGTAQIGDLVWLDVDADGSTDAGEPGVPDAGITVTWLGGDGVAGGGDDFVAVATTSDLDGGYVATGLPAGNFEVAVVSGIADGLGNSGDPDGNGDGRTVIAGVNPGDTETAIDFGYAGGGTVGDSVFWDLDADGMQSPREPGMSDVPVSLTWAGWDGSLATGDDVTWAATTDGTGGYLFTDLPPGTCLVAIDGTAVPPGVGPASDPDTVTDGATQLVIGPYETHREIDFGLRGDGTAAGTIWIDVDSDGDRQTGEPGVRDGVVTITYLGPDAPTGTDAVFTAVTGTDGTYHVPGLPSGFYEIEFDEASLPDGLALTGDNPIPVTLGAGATVAGIDFRTTGTGTIGGTVWNDRDGDELRGDAEVGVASVGIDVVWRDQSGDVLLAGETDAFGAWRIENLPPGIYDTAIDPLSVPLGMSPTTATDVPIVVDPAGTAAADFGIALMLRVGSKVWVDGNGNGVVDAGEDGVSAVLVNLYDELGSLVAFTGTDGGGSYGFDDLFPGTYVVQIDYASVPGHLRPTWDRDGVIDMVTTVDLTGGVHVLDANFGFQAGLPLTGFDVDVLALWGALLTMFGIGLVLASQIYNGRDQDGEPSG